MCGATRPVKYRSSWTMPQMVSHRPARRTRRWSSTAAHGHLPRSTLSEPNRKTRGPCAISIEGRRAADAALTHEMVRRLMATVAPDLGAALSVDVREDAVSAVGPFLAALVPW